MTYKFLTAILILGAATFSGPYITMAAEQNIAVKVYTILEQDRGQPKSKPIISIETQALSVPVAASTQQSDTNGSEIKTDKNQLKYLGTIRSGEPHYHDNAKYPERSRWVPWMRQHHFLITQDNGSNYLNLISHEPDVSDLFVAIETSGSPDYLNRYTKLPNQKIPLLLFTETELKQMSDIFSNPSQFFLTEGYRIIDLRTKQTVLELPTIPTSLNKETMDILSTLDNHYEWKLISTQGGTNLTRVKIQQGKARPENQEAIRLIEKD